MRSLNGQEIVDFVKERQLKQVRGLRQAYKIKPLLAIVSPDAAQADRFFDLIADYADDILIDVEVFVTDDVAKQVGELNANDAYHGIVVLGDTEVTIVLQKDVEGLSTQDKFEPPVLTALDWLLAGYNVELLGKQIVIVGKNRIADLILAKLTSAEYNVQQIPEAQKDIILKADVVITTTSASDTINASMLKTKAVAIDLGQIVGQHNNLSSDLTDRKDIVATPRQNGIEPLVTSALLDNVIQAALSKIQK